MSINRGDVFAATLLSLGVLAMTVALPTVINDWHYHVEGGRALLSADGLRVYADHRDVQIGPLTLLLAAVIDGLAGSSGSAVVRIVIALAFGPLIIWAVRVAAPNGLAAVRWRLLMVWCAAAGLGWVALASSRHLDDAMATAFIVAALATAVAARPVWSGICLALAVWSKPWAIITAPSLRANGKELPKAIGVGALGLVPLAAFVLAAPEALAASQVYFAVDSSSPLRLFTDTTPSWLRVAQLVFALLVGAFVARWSAFAAPVAAVAARLLLDPGVWAYYYGPLLLLAVLADASWKRSWPAVTPIAFIGLFDPLGTPASHTVALVAVVAAAAACAWWDRREVSPAALTNA